MLSGPALSTSGGVSHEHRGVGGQAEAPRLLDADISRRQRDPDQLEVRESDRTPMIVNHIAAR